MVPARSRSAPAPARRPEQVMVPARSRSAPAPARRPEQVMAPARSRSAPAPARRPEQVMAPARSRSAPAPARRPEQVMAPARSRSAPAPARRPEQVMAPARSRNAPAPAPRPEQVMAPVRGPRTLPQPPAAGSGSWRCGAARRVALHSQGQPIPASGRTPNRRRARRTATTRPTHPPPGAPRQPPQAPRRHPPSPREHPPLPPTAEPPETRPPRPSPRAPPLPPGPRTRVPVRGQVGVFPLGRGIRGGRKKVGWERFHDPLGRSRPSLPIPNDSHAPRGQLFFPEWVELLLIGSVDRLGVLPFRG